MDDTATGFGPADPATLERLKAIVGPKGWSDDPAVLEPHLVEPRGRYRGRAALLLRPETTEVVSRVLAVCDAARLPVVPQAGNTGLVGGSIPFDGGNEVVLSLARMNRIRAVDPVNHTMTVEAGCILKCVQDAAEEADRLFPLSYGSEGSCMIGGCLSTNGGGTAVLRYGNARELVLGLEVVLPDGQVLDMLRGLRKDNTGYDLKQLFVGAEGTLGVITAAVLKLFPRPRSTATALAGLPDLDAVIALFERARVGSGDQLTTFELMPRIGLEFATRHVSGASDPLSEAHPWYALVEFSSAAVGEAEGSARHALERVLEAAFEAGMVSDAVLADSSAQAAALWRLREGLVEGQRPEGGSIKHDIAVPVSAVPAFIARASEACAAAIPGIRPVPFGHVGDGNIHFNLSQPEGADRAAFLAQWDRISRIVHDIVAEMGGSISAEHGLGRMKRDEIRRYKAPAELEVMARVKRALDPNGIMNPGKVL